MIRIEESTPAKKKKTHSFWRSNIQLLTHLTALRGHSSVFVNVLFLPLPVGGAGESASSTDRGSAGVSSSILRHPGGAQWQITEQVYQLGCF